MSKKGIFALLAGVAAGTVTGVLFSPTSGKKFRQKLKKEIDSGGYGKKSLFTHFSGLAKDIKNAAETEMKNSGLDKKAKNFVEKVKTAEQNLEKKLKKSTKKVSKKATSKVKSAAKKTIKAANKVDKKVSTATKTTKATTKKKPLKKVAKKVKSAVKKAK
jgi:gas vesicle protein